MDKLFMSNRETELTIWKSHRWSNDSNLFQWLWQKTSTISSYGRNITISNSTVLNAEMLSSVINWIVSQNDKYTLCPSNIFFPQREGGVRVQVAVALQRNQRQDEHCCKPDRQLTVDACLTYCRVVRYATKVYDVLGHDLKTFVWRFCCITI